jgi:cytochrome P450
VVLAAANYDPLVNPEPQRFAVDREARQIFTFGLGQHACPGQRIASATAVAALQALPSLRDKVEHVSYLPSANLRIPSFGPG